MLESRPAEPLDEADAPALENNCSATVNAAFFFADAVRGALAFAFAFAGAMLGAIEAATTECNRSCDDGLP
jgi:hypothetical protein